MAPKRKLRSSGDGESGGGKAAVAAEGDAAAAGKAGGVRRTAKKSKSKKVRTLKRMAYGKETRAVRVLVYVCVLLGVWPAQILVLRHRGTEKSPHSVLVAGWCDTDALSPRKPTAPYEPAGCPGEIHGDFKKFRFRNSEFRRLVSKTTLLFSHNTLCMRLLFRRVGAAYGSSAAG